jgi:O-antigen ligase
MSEFEWIKEGTLTKRFVYLNTAGLDAFSERARTSLVETALERFSDSPVFGHGYLFHSTSAFGYTGPHNEFLKYALDFGLFGFLAYFAFLATAIRTFWKRKFFRGVFFGLLMAIASFGTHNMMETRPLIILMALLLGESVTMTRFRQYES